MHTVSPFFRFFNLTYKLHTIMCVLLLTACFDTPNENPNTKKITQTADAETIITGYVENGTIENGVVRIYQISNFNNSNKASTTPFGLPAYTNKQGFFSFNLPNTTQASSILIEVTADESTRMTCVISSGCYNSTSQEHTPFGQKISLNSSFKISAISPTIQHGYEHRINVSTLSHLAVSLAKNKEEGLSKSNVETSYHYIEKIMGLSTGALNLTPPDLSKLDQLSLISKTEIKTSIASAAFLAQLSSPDWPSISEIINYASKRISMSGSLAAVNMSALPDITLGDLYFQTAEIARSLMIKTSNPDHKQILTLVANEADTAYQFITMIPEFIDAVEILEQPVSIDIDEGELASFMVFALGGNNLSYQWRLNEKIISGANESIYTIAHANASNAGTYDVIISNELGSEISLSALLTVHTFETQPEPNTPPIAYDEAIDIFEDTATEIDVLSNDVDINNDPITISSAEVIEGSGTVVIQDNNSLIYMPALNAVSPATIQYVITDGHDSYSTAQLFIFITPINDAPSPTPDTITTNEDTPITIAVLANDHDSDGDNLSISSASSATGKVSINSNQTLYFQPEKNFNGTVIITYIITDGHGGIATSFATVTVKSINDSPIASDDNVSILEDTPVSINVLINDIDPEGNELHIEQAYSQTGKVTINTDQTLNYIPQKDFHGESTITYTIQDGAGGFSSAKVYISILPVNDKPIAINDTIILNEDTPAIIRVLENDYDIDHDILDIISASVENNNGMVSLNRDKSLTFVPLQDFHGESTIRYTISDQHGETATGLVNIILTPVNDQPILVNQHVSTQQAQEIVIEALAGAYDVDGDYLSITQFSALNGSISLSHEKFLNYLPSAQFTGEDTINYTVSDGNGGSSIGIIFVSVIPNEIPSSIELSWKIPSKRDDGSNLDVSNIKGYQIAYGMNVNNLSSSVYVDKGATINYVIAGLNQGIYYFSIATITYDDIQGSYSEKLKMTIF